MTAPVTPLAPERESDDYPTLACAACRIGNGGRHSCTPEQRFERDVIRGEGCWGWRGHTDRQGYGFITINGRPKRVHRYTYERFRGPVPAWMCVLHRCDNPTCCNPGHLFLGTRAENARDRDRKGRTRNGAKAKTCCSKCGGPFTLCPDGHRRCKPCQRELVRKWAAEQRKRIA